MRVGFVSRAPRLELWRLFGPFVSGLKIPFPGNGDLGSKRLGSNGCFSDPEDEHFRSVLEGGNLPAILGRCGRVGIGPARTRRVSSIGAGLAPLSAPVNRLGASRHVKCVAAAKQRLHSRCLECPLDCGRLVGSCSADGVRHRQRGFIGEYRWVGVNPKCER